MNWAIYFSPAEGGKLILTNERVYQYLVPKDQGWKELSHADAMNAFFLFNFEQVESFDNIAQAFNRSHVFARALLRQRSPNVATLCAVVQALENEDRAKGEQG